MPEHHSVSDFDFSSFYWSLKADKFHSPPSSVSFRYAAGYLINFALLHHSITGPMEQGQIASWFYTSWLGNHVLQAFVFRNISPDGDASVFPFYAVCFTQKYAYWRKYTAPNTYTTIATWYSGANSWIEAGAWGKIRCSWWNGIDTHGVPATVCRIESYLTGVWIPSADAYDPEQVNLGAPVQRSGVGFHPTLYNNTFNYIDDTEFYLPV